MNDRVDRAAGLVRAVVAAARRRDVSFLAAAVAYYAFVSLVPLSLLGFAAATAVGDGALTAPVGRAVDGLLAAEGQDALEAALAGESGRGSATVLGLLALAWSGSRVLRGLDRAFGQVYEGTGRPSLVEQVRDSLIVVGAVLLGLVAMAAVGGLVALLPLTSPVRSLGVVGLWLTLAVALLPVYAVLPDADVDVREALPGALLAAASFVVLASLFGLYTSVAGDFAVYGVLGAVLLLLTWLYFASMLVMVGAVLNAVLAGRVGSFRERPDRDWK